MKNCKNCNAELNNDARFCTVCGTEQDDVITAQAPEQEALGASPAEPVNSNTYFTPQTGAQPAAFNGSAVVENVGAPKKKKGVKAVIAVIAIVAVAILAFVVKGALSGGSSIEPGVVDGNTYTNSSVDVKVNCPDGWKIMNSTDLAEFTGSSVDENGRVSAPDGGYYECVLLSDAGESIMVMTVDGNLVDAAMSEEDFMKQTAAQFSLNGKVGQSYQLTIGGKVYNCIDCSSVSGGVSLNQTMCVVKEGRQYFFILFTLSEYSNETVSKLIDAYFTSAN